MENTSPRDVCQRAGFPSSRCLLSYTTPSSSSDTAGGSVRSKGTASSFDSYSAYSVHPHTYLPEAMDYTGRRRLLHGNNTSDAAADTRRLTWSDLDGEELALANEV